MKTHIARIVYFLLSLLFLLSSCYAEPEETVIRGTPVREGTEPVEEAVSPVLPNAENGETSVDAGVLPPIRIHLAAIGDIMAHEGTYEAAKVGNTYDFDYMFADIAPFLSDADYLVGNLETTFAGRERGYSTYPNFNTPEQMGESLARVLGIDLVSLANNHTMDKGFAGLQSTIAFLDEYGIAHTGAYDSEEAEESLFITEINGAKVAFIAYTYGSNGGKPKPYSIHITKKEALQEDAAAAREAGADYVIALLHWGNEYQRFASKEQRELSEWLFANTEIDLIIGNHAHVTQPIERFEVTYEERAKTGYVLYALGNFTSEQLFEYSNTGIIADIYLVIDREDHRSSYVEEITYTPIFVDPNPKATGKRYRVISVRQAVLDYEAGADDLISSKEYQQLSQYLKDYEELLCTDERVREGDLPS